ncbi:COX15/CtaA family protein [Sphingobacterium humi]|uniref:Heme A synthase n=1 Tax=Sphingobacterium humi TaxID=1796905 RepID=A0A6N8KY70_9SPHI|nr:COX15/CtaA family protein [Sphingobacterium humi]MVZ61659.1 heme A synthase [Sphingobacterium humi]
MFPSAEKRFIRINKITIFVLFLVITAGGVVRSTGSGMGCPDWPKCFNRIIPPTDASQLPEGYEKLYVEGRVKKNMRFANMIEFFGYSHLADQIRHDETILEHEEFNAAKTWTEYVNRLFGVLSGFCLLFSAIYSLTYWKKKKAIAIWSVLNLIVVVIQAWLGSIVVSTNLTPWVITIHMLLAIVIVCISIHTYFMAVTYRDKSILKSNSSDRSIFVLSVISIVLLVIQVVYGTEVREAIDHLNALGTERNTWIDAVGLNYHIHRILAYITFALTAYLFVKTKSVYVKASQQYRFALIAFALVCIQMLSGIILARFHVPAVAQTVHLVVATLFFGAQYYLMLLVTKPKETLAPAV